MIFNSSMLVVIFNSTQKQWRINAGYVEEMGARVKLKVESLMKLWNTEVSNRFTQSRRQSCRFRGASVYHQGGPKFEIKHKSRCVQKSKLVDWGVKHVD